MLWPATDRYELRRAPGGLAFVQDLLNTAAAGRPRAADLLDDVSTAQQWLDAAVAAWCGLDDRDVGGVIIGTGDLAPLRELRSQLHNALESLEDHARSLRPSTAASVPASVSLRSDGTVTLEPEGPGWRWVASAVLGECFVAQRLDTWRRLKICRNERCPVAFYDQSRNNSGVWHDVRTCGNVVNLRASRARRRAHSQAS
jgi:hypothetical protein